MSEEKKDTPVFDADELADKAATRALEALRAEREAQEQAEKDLAELREEVAKEEREKIEAELKADGDFRAGFHVGKSKDGLSEKEEYGQAYRTAMWQYLRTGNARPLRHLGAKEEAIGDLSEQIVNFADPDIRAAFQEDTGSEGGFLVPNDFFPQIVAKRDQASWVRSVNPLIINTSRDIVDVPAENASEGVFARTAEEAAYDTDAGPSFSNVQITVYKFTRTHRVSEELEADDAAGFPSFLADSLGRAWGLTENNFVAVGTGSNQPQGVFIGADTDDILSLAGSDTITSAEFVNLMYQLPDEYRRDDDAVAFLMHRLTERGLVNTFSTSAPETAPYLQFNQDAGDKSALSFAGVPLINDGNISQGGASNFIGLIGNFRYYALVQRSGLVVSRNPWLYQANGQIGIFAKARWGGAVLQDEAFKVAQNAA